MAGRMAGNGDTRGGKDRPGSDEDRARAARRLLESAREKRENPYKTPPNLFTTKDHQGK